MIAPLLALVLGQVPPQTLPAADVDPPIITDLAVAASSREAAPVITAAITDAESGVGEAVVHYRAKAKKRWQSAALRGSGGLFLAQLPDGLQRTGFEYWVAATDVAGNGPTRIGSEDHPIWVEAASVSTTRALAQRSVAQGKKTDPLWAVVAVGVGVVSGATGGLFAIETAGLHEKSAELEAVLGRDDLSANLRARLVKRRSGFEDAALQQTVIASTLGGIAVLSIVTGATILALGELE